MKLEIENLTNEIVNIKDIKRICKIALKKLNIKKVIFNIVLTTDEEIHKINKEYRGVDRQTDVISFAFEDNGVMNYKDYRVLGEIYISVDTAKRQAIEYNHSFKREICFLSLHGLLHLLGYDHMKKEEEKVMFGLQDEILHIAKVER